MKFVAALLLASCAGSAPAVAPVLVVYGDSLSLTGGGWPQALERTLKAQGIDAVVRTSAVNGGGLVWRTTCFGEPALARLRAERSIQPGSTIVVMAGVNDLIQPRLPADFSDCFDPADFGATQLIAALLELKAEQRSGRLMLATLPPFGRSEFYNAAAETERQTVNRWIRSNWKGDDVIDLDRILAQGDALAPEYDSGDGLHPNERGAARIAAEVARLQGLLEK